MAKKKVSTRQISLPGIFTLNVLSDVPEAIIAPAAAPAHPVAPAAAAPLPVDILPAGDVTPAAGVDDFAMLRWIGQVHAISPAELIEMLAREHPGAPQPIDPRQPFEPLVYSRTNLDRLTSDRPMWRTLTGAALALRDRNAPPIEGPPQVAGGGHDFADPSFVERLLCAAYEAIQTLPLGASTLAPPVPELTDVETSELAEVLDPAPVPHPAFRTAVERLLALYARAYDYRHTLGRTADSIPLPNGTTLVSVPSARRSLNEFLATTTATIAQLLTAATILERAQIAAIAVRRDELLDEAIIRHAIEVHEARQALAQAPDGPEHQNSALVDTSFHLLSDYVRTHLTALNYPPGDIRLLDTPWTALHGPVIAATDYHVAIDTRNGTYRILPQADLPEPLFAFDTAYLTHDHQHLHATVDRHRDRSIETLERGA